MAAGGEERGELDGGGLVWVVDEGRGFVGGEGFMLRLVSSRGRFVVAVW